MTSLSVSQLSYAQETQPDADNEVKTDLDFPTPKHMVGQDGTQYAAFTIEQYEQLIRMANAYYYLGEVFVLQQQKILNFQFQINEYQQEILLYSALNETLKAENNQFEEQNNILSKRLEKDKKTRFLKTLGVSALVGVSFGLIGIGIGKAL